MFNKLPISESFRAFLSRWLMSPLQGITFSRWIKALSQNSFRVSPRYWPRAFLTTCASLKNSLEARQKEKKFGLAIKQVEVKRPIFILGHYRSGTTHLHNLLAVDTRLAYPNYLQATHPRTFMISEAKIQDWARNIAPTRRPYDNVELGLATPAEDELALCNDNLLSPHMAWHFPKNATGYEKYVSFDQASASEISEWQNSLETFAKKLTLKYSGRQLVFKSPCHTARIRLILEVFPDALFINIHRDPYRVFVSTKYMEIKSRPLFSYQKIKLDHLDDFIFRRYKTIYEAYFRDVSLIPKGQFFEMSYDQLDRDSVQTMEQVYRDLALPDFTQVKKSLFTYVAGLKNYQKNRYQDLPQEIKNRINQEWGFCFRAWDYTMASKAIPPGPEREVEQTKRVHRGQSSLNPVAST